MISEDINDSEGSSCDSENESGSSSDEAKHQEESKHESDQFHSAISSKNIKIGASS